MLLHLKRWLAAPIFPDAEIKTRRAGLLNAALLTTAALASIVLVGNVLGGKTPGILSGADAAAIIICFILRHWMQRGQVSLASVMLIGLDLVGITVFVAYLGTIRTPTAAFYLLVVIGGGLLFDIGGIIATTAASSLAVLGLIVAENAGVLPRPDYAVTITQWITYTALFGLSGGLTFVALQSTRQALTRADGQLVVRQRAEAALHESEARYRRLVEGSPDIAYIFSDQRGGLYYSPRAESVLGYTRHYLNTHPFLWNESIHPDDRVYVARAIQEFAAGQAFDIEYRIRDAHGAWLWLRDRSIGRRVEDGEILIEGLASDITTRKQTEEVLRENEERLRTLGDNLPEAALYRYAHDVQGQPHFEYVSAGIERLTGIAPSDIIDDATALLRTIVPEDTPRFNQAEVKSRETLSRFEIEVRERHSLTGEVRWALLRSSPRRRADGSTVWDGVQLDITDRKRAESQREAALEALQQSEAVYHTLVETLPLNIFRKDVKGRLTFANTLYCRTQGWSLAEILGKTDYDLHPRELADKYHLDDERVIATGETFETVEEHQPIDGPKTYVQVIKTPLYGSDGGVIGIQGAFWDVTDRQRMEEELQQRTQALSALQDTLLDIASPHRLPELLNLVVERAARLLDSASGGLYLCDPERREVKCVVSYHTLRDYTDIILHYGEGAAGTVAQTGQPLIIQDYRTWPGRAHIFDADEPFSAVLSTPMRWHGQVTGVIHVLRDDERRPFTSDDLELLSLFANHAAIAVEQARLTASLEQELTERERAEDALRELNAALEERVAERTRELLDANLRLTELDRLKDEFISRISHELRTPLANIKIYLELLEHGKPEKHEPYLRTLHEQADKLQRLIDDLLDVAYLNVDVIEAHRDRSDVNALAHELVTDRTAQAHERDLTLILAQSPDVPRLTTDRALLRQALGNVLTNALNYTPRGGAITVSTAQCVWAGTTWVTIEVRDTGPGIAEKDLPHIFEPFYRGAAASDYKTPGTGVGLTIARSILERLGGRITVDAPPGQGAAFTIWLRAE